MRIGDAPLLDKGLEFGFFKALVKGAHGDECAGGSAVAEGEFCDFSFLSEMVVLSMPLYRDMEHGGGGGAVDVFVVFEGLDAPGFTGDVGEDAGFDGGEVGNDEFVAGCGNEGGADQLGEGVRDVFVEHS